MLFHFKKRISNFTYTGVTIALFDSLSTTAYTKFLRIVFLLFEKR